MKDSLPIVHDPVRSKHIRQAARPPSSERMQCYLSLLLSNKLRLILREGKREKKEQDPVRFATLYYYPPYPPTQQALTSGFVGVRLNGNLLESSVLRERKRVSTVVIFALM